MSAKNFKDLSGSAFGQRSVTDTYEVRIKHYGPRPNGQRVTYWLCNCSCGRSFYVVGAHLVNGSSTKCRVCSAHSRFENGHAQKNTVLCGYKCDAKDRGYCWDLTDDIFFSLCKEPCFYCGDLPRNISKSIYGTGDFIYNGVDRKDNSLGYTKDNTVTCCRICNRAKSNICYEDWMSYLSRVATRQKGL